MKQIKRKSSISIGLTLLIVALLIFSGLPPAVSINVSSLPTKIEQGKPLSFTLDMNIKTGKVDIYNITINVVNSTGSSVGKYAFYPIGKNITSGINVYFTTPAAPSGSRIELEYNITITAFSKLSPGKYSLRILVNSGTGNHHTTVTVLVV